MFVWQNVIVDEELRTKEAGFWYTNNWSKWQWIVVQHLILVVVFIQVHLQLVVLEKFIHGFESFSICIDVLSVFLKSIVCVLHLIFQRKPTWLICSWNFGNKSAKRLRRFSILEITSWIAVEVSPSALFWTSWRFL